MFNDIPSDKLEAYTDLLKRSGSINQAEALAAQDALAAVITPVLRAGITDGDNTYGVFKEYPVAPGARAEFPIDLFRIDNADDFTAYTIPVQGKIPQRQVSGDYLEIPTFDVGNSVDWLLRYAREAQWPIVSRALEVMEAGFVQKSNNDSWHVIMAAAFDRNIVVSDSNADAGQFTKRLVSLMKLIMRRNGGGNSTSLNRSRLTHLFVSPEALEDMRNWDAAEVDEVTRRELYIASDTGDAQVFGVKIVALDELGEGQEYQTYYQNIIATGAPNNGMASGDVEIVVGLDLSNPGNAFVKPVKEPIQTWADPTLHRERREGYYAWCSYGLGVLDSSKTLLGSL